MQDLGRKSMGKIFMTEEVKSLVSGKTKFMTQRRKGARHEKKRSLPKGEAFTAWGKVFMFKGEMVTSPIEEGSYSHRGNLLNLLEGRVFMSQKGKSLILEG